MTRRIALSLAALACVLLFAAPRGAGAGSAGLQPGPDQDDEARQQLLHARRTGRHDRRARRARRRVHGRRAVRAADRRRSWRRSSRSPTAASGSSSTRTSTAITRAATRTSARWASRSSRARTCACASRSRTPAPTASRACRRRRPACRSITYDSPMTIRMNGEEVRLIPAPAAHTDGDTFVKFVNADVIMTGDFYRSIQYPNIDRANGGSLPGLIDALNAVIENAGPNTKIVPGHGPIVDRAAVDRASRHGRRASRQGRRARARGEDAGAGGGGEADGRFRREGSAAGHDGRSIRRPALRGAEEIGRQQGGPGRGRAESGRATGRQNGESRDCVRDGDVERPLRRRRHP